MKKNDYRLAILFKKRIEFFDKFQPIYCELNAYLSTIEALVKIEGKGANKKAQERALINNCVKNLDTLYEQYYIYLPKNIKEKTGDLWIRSLALESNPNEQQASRCLDLLFRLQDDIRIYVQRNR